MPFGDGTGPRGGGMGRGQGGGMGRGAGRGRRGGNRAGAGPGGYCICPSCGAKVEHKIGMPCFSVSCPKCGNKMMRT